MIKEGDIIKSVERPDLTWFDVHFHTTPPSNVQLLGYTQTPEGWGPENLLAYGMRAYTDIWELAEMSKEDREKFAKDTAKTALATPAEMVNLVFFIDGVSRSWTHQAVRYRVGTSYVQQSMRMFGQGDRYDVLATHQNQQFMDQYVDTIVQSIKAYDDMVLNGCPIQDARGVFPHHVLTKMMWSMSLRTLMQVFNTRWCCMAQKDEWIPVLRQMKKAVRAECGDIMADMLTSPILRGEDCGFHASFDKPCRWRRADGSILPEEEQS